MPTAIAYRRAPLVDPALVPLSDAAVHADGLQKQLTELALGLVDINRMSSLDAALATKLGGYTQTPPFPDVEAAAGLLPAEPDRFAALLRAASMLAAMGRISGGRVPETPFTQPVSSVSVMRQASSSPMPRRRGARAASERREPPQSGQVSCFKNFSTRFMPFSSLTLASAFCTCLLYTSPSPRD